MQLGDRADQRLARREECQECPAPTVSVTLTRPIHRPEQLPIVEEICSHENLQLLLEKQFAVDFRAKFLLGDLLVKAETAKGSSQMLPLRRG